ncbi:inosine-5'-monophosphate dehydrogenase [Sphaceloma murrayae]|uniref:Inosine-5'-monophosphate dehydrogenase n=1 Tax=Sphaceloma murrayae TaxID=2082308 RepID=A0A2K1QKB3_9PEZI|nr:inosine-5'-monophosphate dehydrogenase [Sphaceloma murrayae]
MAFLFPRGPVLLGLTALGASSILLGNPLAQRRRLMLDSSPSSVSARDWSYSQYQRDASVPVFSQGGGLNPRAIRQISAGSIIGVLAGMAVSTFSKPLTLIIGLLILGITGLESRGISIVPYKRIQKYVTNVDLRSLIQDNAAFKLSFGATFALTGFADF